MEKLAKIRNNAIDIFRYICAILVVCVHAVPFAEINSNLSYFFVQILPRVAVPFFFTISGYYYIKKILEEGADINKIFWKYVLKLLILYSLWSIIYIMIKFIQGLGQGIDIFSFLKQTILNYFFYGSYYHLWFFPALFFSISITTLFAKMKKVKWLAYSSIVLYIIGCLGCSYFAIGEQIPLIKGLIHFSHFKLIRTVILMGLPFFIMGYFVNLLQEKIKRINSNTYILIYIRYYHYICS